MCTCRRLRDIARTHSLDEAELLFSPVPKRLSQLPPAQQAAVLTHMELSSGDVSNLTAWGMALISRARAGQLDDPTCHQCDTQPKCPCSLYSAI